MPASPPSASSDAAEPPHTPPPDARGAADDPDVREPPEHLPISHLNALLYCPRRFYYEFAEGEMLVNEHVLQGRVHHQATDTHGTRHLDGTLRMRKVYVYSDRLRIAGLIDAVEGPLAKQPDASSGDTEPTDPLAAATSGATLGAPMVLYPVEYKKGSAHGGRANDHVQLCAQGMCLEERACRPIAGGYLFSFETMHRTWLPFTPELRALTEATIAEAFALLRAGRLPPPLPAEQDRKCRACSLEPLCLPREVRVLAASQPLLPDSPRSSSSSRP